MTQRHVIVFGAGSIGCYIGGLLAHAGARVTLVMRARLSDEIREHGLTLTDLHGSHVHIRPGADHLLCVTDIADAAPADLVLVTVKSRDTKDAGQAIADYLANMSDPSGAHGHRPRQPHVISLQNGISNPSRLMASLGPERVIPGMVGFNVVHKAAGAFHRGTAGTIAIDGRVPLDDAWHQSFRRGGIPLDVHPDFARVQWGKLLLNLNNPVNALSGLPLVTELQGRDYRRTLAAIMTEALVVMGKAGIRPMRLTSLPHALVPRILNLPTWAFVRVAKKTLAMDPHARSSMWEDLQAGRQTEIDDINGEVVRLAQRIGREAPYNARIVTLIKDAQAARERDPSAETRYTGPALWRAIQQAPTT